MTPLDLGLVVSAAVFCLVPLAAARFRGRAAVASALVVGVFALLAIVTEGLRWEWLLVGVAVLVSATLLVARRPREPRRAPRRRFIRLARRILATGLSGACFLVVVLGGVAAVALPRPRFGVPTGPYAVGTTTAQWTDPSRPEPETADPADHRTIVAQAWYPATVAGAGERAWYLGRTPREAAAVTRGLADTYGVPQILLSEVQHARQVAVADAPFVDGSARFPVVLFSPGLNGVRFQNTAWATELASHGYVVVALDHPYTSAVMVLDNGQVVTTAATATGNDALDRRHADAWTSVRAADLRFALDQVELRDIPGLPELDGHLDLARVAAAGHSLGGAAAIQAAGQDRRLRAVVDLDGLPRNVAPSQHLPALLALTSGPKAGRPSANDLNYATQLHRVLQQSAAGSYIVAIPGAAHLTFTDAPLYLPPVPALVGSLGRTRGSTITADATRAFLDATLEPDRTQGLAATLAHYGPISAR